MYFVKINTTNFQFVTNFMRTKFLAKRAAKNRISNLKKTDGKIINIELWRISDGKRVLVETI